MKKLMIALAAVAMAACTQASMVYWQFADLTSNESSFSTAQNLQGYTAYLISSTDWSADDVATSLSKAQDSIASKDWAKSVYTPPKSAQFTINKTAAENLDLNTGKGAFYIVFADGDKYWASSELTGVDILEDGSIATEYTVAKISLSNATAIKTSDMKSMSGGTPEPTSAMLLLLGVAGLALKRKQA